MTHPTGNRFASPCHRLVSLQSPSTTAVTLDQESYERDFALSQRLGEDSTSTFPLTSLPVELIGHVFRFLDSEAPSEAKFDEHPTSDFTVAEETPLKDVSRVCKMLRRVVLPQLFAHTRLDPYDLTPFLAFLRESDIAKHIESIVAQLQASCNHFHPVWYARLLKEIPSARTFTIICAPHVWADFVKITTISSDTWAFNMPYQILRLRQSPDSTNSRISLNDLPNLFDSRPWVDLSINEGSSLKAYTTYEYFLRRTPSLLAALHTRRSSIADSMLAGLESFTFIAIFPFYNHVDEILKSIRKMKNLRVLRTKICPKPGSTVFDDEIQAAGNHIDVNDPWNEVYTSYNIIAHTVGFLTVEGQLQEFRVDDVKIEGIRETIESSITQRLQGAWGYGNSGVWTRKMAIEPVN